MTTYTSDTYGRRTRALSSEEGTTTYAWDPLGHLTEVASADATSTYEYGISGMREKVTVETTAGVTWRESVWSGGQLIAERDSDGTLLTYVWGPDRTPLAVKVASYTHPSGTYYYHTDAAGSVTALTDESGEVVASYSYDAFGALTDIGGSDAWLAGGNPLRYRAYYADDETGLYYLPARYYEPSTARFLSPDPAPPSAGDPLSLNAYAYCQGDPVNASDPTGAIMDLVYECPKGVAAGVHVMNAVRQGASSKAAYDGFKGSLTYRRDARSTMRFPAGFINHPDGGDVAMDAVGALLELGFYGGLGLAGVTKNPGFAKAAIASSNLETVLDFIGLRRKGTMVADGKAGPGDLVVQATDLASGQGSLTSTARLLTLDALMVFSDADPESYRLINDSIEKWFPGWGYR